MKKYVVEIPAGKAYVSASDIPNWIANSLVPMPAPDTPVTVMGFHKWTVVGDRADKRFRDDIPLTAEDFELLKVIYGSLPMPSRATTRAQWLDYEKAFENSPNKPQWELRPIFDDPIGYAKIERAKIVSKYYDLMEVAIREKKLKVRDADRTPASKLKHDSIIRVEDARVFMAEFEFELRATKHPLPAPAAAAPSVPPQIQEDPKTSYIPLEYAAYRLAEIQWGDHTPAEDALQMLKILGASTSGVEPVCLMRCFQEESLKVEIKALVMAGKLPLYKFDPLSANKMLPTKSIEGAFVLLSEIAEILTQEEIRRNLEAEEMHTAPLPLSSAVTTNALPASPPLTEAQENITTHKITTRIQILDAEISQAKNNALDESDPKSVYAELIKMAEAKPPVGLLIGYSSDGIQYRGKSYQASQTPDVFTPKNLRDRMSREAKRGKTH